MAAPRNSKLDAVRLRRRTEELSILNALAGALNGAPDLREALTQVLRLVAELLGLQTGWVWLLDGETGQFYSAAARNLPPCLEEPLRMTGHACWCIDAFRKGKLTPRNISMMECSRLAEAVEAGEVEATLGLRAHASIPLYFQDRPLGIMNVTGPAWRELTPDELRLLATVADQVGVAIERARLAEASARLALAEERARIAREIHDTLAQGLTAIILHLESARHHLEADPDRARGRLDRALTTARTSLEEARQSVLSLRAAPTARRPLIQSMEAFARSFTAETGIRVRVRVRSRTEAPAALPPQVETELFRIAQEALANVRRHAGVGEALLILQQTADTVRLFIHDRGRGFEASAVPETCYGIVGMRERAALLGGRLRIHSRRGWGTTLVAEAPLRNEGRPPALRATPPPLAPEEMRGGGP